MSATSGRSGPGPATLRWAVRLLHAEAVALAAVTAYVIYADLTMAGTDLRRAIGVTLFAVLATVSLALVGRALARRSPGARAPAVVFQLMLLGIGYLLLQGGQAWAGVPLTVLALVVVALVISPPTTRALGLH